VGGIDELKKYPLALWNDSAVASDMREAVRMGCRGGTSNPPLILKAARACERWALRAAELGDQFAPKTAAWMLADEIRTTAARELMPVFEATGGREGRMCVQVDPRDHEDADAMVEQALALNRLAPNLSIKMPLTRTGLKAIRRGLELGLCVTATASFTMSQVLTVTKLYADYIESHPGEKLPGLNAVLMVGRLDDYLRVLNEQRGLEVPESVITQAGVAVAKRTYQELRRRNLPGFLLLAAPRGLYHITEFLTMDAGMTAGPAVRQMAYDSPELVVPGNAPTAEALETLTSAFPEFAMAYQPDGLAPEEFLGYGAMQRTMGEFISAQEGLEQFAGECREKAPA